MQEIELKFLVPESRIKSLLRQAKIKSSQEIQMAAHYYDTPEQQLAQAGIGLRIRQEGDTWVQTIKAGGDGIAARLEHNATLDSEQVQAMLDTNTLMPDLTIYKNTTIASALSDFKLKKLSKKLTRQYVTDIQRTTRLLLEDKNDEDTSRLEMAYDVGEVIHGNDPTQRNPIQEIEFELLSGEVDFLFATAKIWCKRYKLCLSTVTKAERGGLLIKGQRYSPAVSADISQIDINKDSSMPAFVRAAVHNCLLQILPNSSAVVTGCQNDEHILQLLLGIQRMNTVLKVLASFSDEINPDWLLILKQTATLLNDYRKLAYLASHVESELQKSGAPAVDWTTDVEGINITPLDVIRANDFQLSLLELIAFTMSDPSLEPQTDKLAVDKIIKILSKQHTKLFKSELDFDDASANDANEYLAKYKLLNHLKDLRYFSELSAPLFNKKESKKKTKRWLKRIKKAQVALHQQLDTAYYQQCYQNKALTDINALYGAGWLSASLITADRRTKKQLSKLQSCSTFW